MKKTLSLRLRCSHLRENSKKLLVFGVIFGAVFWLIKTVLEILLIYKGDISKAFFLQIGFRGAWGALLTLIFFIGIGVYIKVLLLRKGSGKEKLEESDILKEIFLASRDSIFVKDCSLKYVLVNPAMEELFDLPASEIINKTDTELFGEEAGRKIEEVDRRVLQGEIIEEEPTKKIRGKPYTFLTLKAPLKDLNGNIIGLLGIARDITERKKDEEKLRDTERNFREVLENSRDGIYKRNLKTDSYDYLSPAVVKLTGFSFDEFRSLGSTGIEERYHPEDQAAMKKFFTELKNGVINSKAVQKIEYRWKCKDDEYRWFSDNCSVLFDKDGEPSAIIATVRDVTDRKKIEEALHQSESHYRLLVENVDLGITLSDAEYCTVTVNPGFTKLYGKKAEDYIGKICYQELHNRDSVCPDCPGAKAMQNGKPKETEKELHLKDGSLKKIRVMVFPTFASNGKVSGFIEIVEDITKRKRAEEILEFEREQLLSIFNGLNEAVYVTDPKTNKILYVNNFLKELLGKDPVGDYCYEVLQGKDQPCEFCTNEIILKNKGQPYQWEFYNPYLDKDSMLFDRIIRWPDGRDVRIELAFDITERKKVEKALQDSENLLRTVINAAKEAMISIDEAGLITIFNPSAEEIFGRAKEEMVGQPLNSLMPEKYRQKHQNYVKSFFQTGKPDKAIGEVLELPGVRSDGEEFPMEISLSAGTYSNKKFVIAVARDITERKKVEEALRNSERRLAEIINFLPEAIFAIDINRNVIVWNQAMEGLTGVSAGKMLGKGNFEYALPFYGVRRPILMDLILQPDEEIEKNYPFIQKDQDTFSTEVYIPTFKGGTYFWSKASPLYDAQGNIIGAIESVRDITERKKLEEQLGQASKMEAVGRLAGGVAHDFNNLLTTIIGYSQLFMRTLPENDSRRKDAEEIFKAGERGALLTKQLLAFSRRQIIEPKIVNLNDIVVNIDKMLRRLIGEDVELFSLQAPDLMLIKVDPSQVDQIILNLAVNARDAMPNGGVLTIETANVTLDEQYSKAHFDAESGNYVMLAVSDTGIGMTPEVKAKAFEPFFTTKKVGVGTGLGLATVYGIVKQSGGFIHLYSEPNQGTSLKIYFPALEYEAISTTKSEALEELPRGNETILFVEDEDTVRKLALRLLADYGYKVLEARHGGEALFISEQFYEKIHLIVTDVVMPQMGGVELADRIRKKRPEIKVLLISGYTNNTVVHRGVHFKDVEFMQKPFSEESLITKVREVLDS